MSNRLMSGTQLQFTEGITKIVVKMPDEDGLVGDEGVPQTRSFKPSELAMAQEGRDGWVMPHGVEGSLSGEVTFVNEPQETVFPVRENWALTTAAGNTYTGETVIHRQQRHTCGIDGDPGAVAPLDGVCVACGPVISADGSGQDGPVGSLGNDPLVSTPAPRLLNLRVLPTPQPKPVPQMPPFDWCGAEMAVGDVPAGRYFLLEDQQYRKGTGWKFELNQHQAFADDGKQTEVFIRTDTRVLLVPQTIEPSPEAAAAALAALRSIEPESYVSTDEAEAYHAAQVSSVPQGFAPQVIKLVRERGAAYGTPAENHQLTADLWSSWLSRRLRTTIHLSAEDVCMLNVLQKQSRLAFTTKDDSWFDVAGYTENVAMLEPHQRNVTI